MTEKKKKRMKFITSCRLCPFVISAAVSSSSCRCPSPPPAPFLLFSFFSHLPSLTIWLCVFSIYSPPHGMLGASNNEKARKPASTRRLYERFLLRDDYRRRLPQWTWRFTGYRQPGDEPPSPLPFPPFTCHHVHQHSFSRRVLLPYHHYVLRRVGRPPFWCHRVTACSTSQFHRRAIRFGSGWTAITRLWVLNPRYQDYLDNTAFHGSTFVNGGLCMATALLAMVVLGMVHPPAGATALNAAVEPSVIFLSWRYLPVVLASALIMQGWAFIINNLGRRRYPVYWWSPAQVFVRPEVSKQEDDEEIALETLQEGPFLRILHKFIRTKRHHRGWRRGSGNWCSRAVIKTDD
ncbi:Hypothetical protein CGB_N0015W [Cryptococcus gattii WM276]|uniref:HPP transmembrane region domain-containing protein n=1 Tax=Cryptococcus gattii serotype B (strain WM276 / ATCC MYA-4071) TaxID=367775 RepID=E6RFQ7_CRYGW|nr:Hypothetical protein CGB_N0015W [Cryptococcus gattii WM276]ADV25653.1 Hypothetical protein CGB_N0015W [Cryptococcus gattii WM276]KJD99650.1 HPP family protein [Cryptococcus gattii NT-10]